MKNPLLAAPEGWEPPAWIPVTTPPRQSGWFWVTVEDPDGRRYVRQRWHSIKDRAWIVEHGGFGRVTAWMPLVPHRE